MWRITFKEAARRLGYKSEKSFEKNYIKTGIFSYYEDRLPNGRIRKLVDAELIEKRLSENKFQYR